MGTLRRNLKLNLLGATRYMYEASVCTWTSEKPLMRLGLVSDGAEITSEEQYHPFTAYRSELRRELGVVSRYLSLQDVLRNPVTSLSGFDALLLKLSFRTARSDAVKAVKAIRSATRAPLVYFDGDDDLCVQWPELLEDIDLYVKKHVFRDRSEYAKPRTGKSNLTEYVHDRFGISFADDPIADQSDPVSSKLIHKVVACANLAVDRKIMNLYQSVDYGEVFKCRRDIDVMFRGNVPDDWMGTLRQSIRPSLQRLNGAYRIVSPTHRVSPKEYYRELKASRICVSPFGYGEICWRDFEAVLCGALLVKPHMGHVETNPDIFPEFETYVPVRWDFSDLEERCSFYLENEEERLRIAKAAFSTLDMFYRDAGFVRLFNQILERVS